ncbi:MAG: hypothetical protein AAF456_15280 [Planctomycetota bacterium]
MLFQASRTSSTHADLSSSDGSVVTVGTGRGAPGNHVELEVGTTTTKPSPTRIEFAIACPGINSKKVSRRIEFFNYDLDRWELVDEGAMDVEEAEITLQQNRNLSRFVQPGTNRIEVRICLETIAEGPFELRGYRSDQVENPLEGN